MFHLKSFAVATLKNTLLTLNSMPGVDDPVRPVASKATSARYLGSNPSPGVRGLGLRNTVESVPVPALHMTQKIETGVVHKLPADLKKAVAVKGTLELWNDITPLARNEFICWVEDAKKPETRAKRIKRTCEELHEGMRRPCCWPGCKHR